MVVTLLVFSLYPYLQKCVPRSPVFHPVPCVAVFITNGAPVVVTLLAFSLYPYLQKEPLSAAKAFSSLALFDILSLPLHLFPLIVNVIINGKVRWAGVVRHVGK